MITQKETKTTCPYCGVGCGVLIKKINDKKVASVGDKNHPANFGRLCVKGVKLSETLSIDDRAKEPQINGEKVKWDEAIEYVAKGFKQSIKKYGAKSVAFYVSGQLLTEDYYIANKLMKGFIGSSNIDTNSRLCMSSSVSGYKRAFGSDSVPSSYEDFDYTDLIILVGTNMAYSHPIIFQRIKQAKKNNPKLKIISIDPRITQTNEIVDFHLAINAGSDGFIFNSLLGYLFDNDLVDNDFISKYTNNVEDIVKNFKKYDYSLKSTSEICGISLADIERFVNYFTTSDKVLSIYSQGINQSSSGTDKVNAIINCHLATGKIGKIGSSPFSITGQPNAMGGREVGGLSNQLASHMDFDDNDIDRVQRFWKAPNISKQEGLKAIDMFDAINNGEIKAIWIIHTNPAVSMPQTAKIKQALEKCPLVVVSDIAKDNDTIKYANVLLPALAWGEKDGTISNSDRTISRQRNFIDNSKDINAKADWEIIQKVAQKMGFKKDFNYSNPYDIFIEHCKLSAFENEKASKNKMNYKLRDFNLSGLSNISLEQYNELEPIQWPVLGKNGTKRMFEDNKFFTDNQKANFICIIPRLPTLQTNKKHPFIFNNGRDRNQWHTMGRTSKSPTLSKHINEPYVSLNETDIVKYKLKENDLVYVYNDLSCIEVRLRKNNNLKSNNCFSSIHYNDTYASNASINNLIPSYKDPVSGQPEFKHSVVEIKSSNMKLYGFIYSFHKIDKEILKKFDYWVEIKLANHYRYEIAVKNDIADFREYIKCSNINTQNQKLFFVDIKKQDYRYIHLDDDVLDFGLFLNKSYDLLPSRRYLSNLSDSNNYQKFLSNESDYEDDGEIICSCFSIGKKSILKAIKENNFSSVEEITKLLKAGSNCGSCLPEIKCCFD